MMRKAVSKLFGASVQGNVQRALSAKTTETAEGLAKKEITKSIAKNGKIWNGNKKQNWVMTAEAKKSPSDEVAKPRSKAEQPPCKEILALKIESSKPTSPCGEPNKTKSPCDEASGGKSPCEEASRGDSDPKSHCDEEKKRKSPCDMNKNQAAKQQSNSKPEAVDPSKGPSTDNCSHHKGLVPPSSILRQLKSFELRSDCSSFRLKSTGHDRKQ